MELITAETKLKKIGTFETRAFNIKAGASAFKILSDSLYSDKITAIIRELSCNAIDSHVVSGQTQQFQLHLPTWNNPIFYIRDFGTGLSKDQIEQIYTTYFESTKNNSNDLIGCLGLGSKTPFSYTSQFAVTSFYNGMKYCYSAFINDEDGCPSISLFGETPTDEPNGVKIEFAVKNSDFAEFESKANNVFLWFATKPELVGNRISLSTFSDYYYQNGINWHLYQKPTTYYGERSPAYVKMGNIAYPIDATKLSSDFPLISLLQHSFVLDMDIGDVEIAPSREALSYNKKTVAKLQARIEKFAEEAAADLNKTVSEFEWYADACHHAVTSKWFAKPFINDLIQTGKVQHNGRKIQQNIQHREILDIVDGEFDKTFKLLVNSGYNRYGQSHSYDVSSSYYASPRKFIDLDAKFGERKLKETLIFNNIRDAYILSRQMSFEKRSKLLELFGYSDKCIIEASSLEIIPPEQSAAKTASATKTPRIGSTKKTSSAWVLSARKPAYAKPKDWWQEKAELVSLEEKTGEKSVYIHIESYQLATDSHHKKSTVEYYRREWQNTDPSIKIYGLTNKQVEKAKKNPEWINIDEWLKSWYEAFFTLSSPEKYYEIYFYHKMFPGSTEVLDSIPDCKLKERYTQAKALFGDHTPDSFSNRLDGAQSYVTGTIKDAVTLVNNNKHKYINFTCGYAQFKSEHPDSAIAKLCAEMEKMPLLKEHFVSFNNCSSTSVQSSDFVKYVELMLEDSEKVKGKV